MKTFTLHNNNYDKIKMEFRVTVEGFGNKGMFLISFIPRGAPSKPLHRFQRMLCQAFACRCFIVHLRIQTVTFGVNILIISYNWIFGSQGANYHTHINIIIIKIGPRVKAGSLLK